MIKPLLIHFNAYSDFFVLFHASKKGLAVGQKTGLFVDFEWLVELVEISGNCFDLHLW